MMVRVKAVARLKIRAVTSAMLAETGSDVALTGVSVSAEAVPVCGNLIATAVKPALVDVSNPASLIGETRFAFRGCYATYAASYHLHGRNRGG